MKNKDAANDAVLTTIPAQGESEQALLERLQRWQSCESAHWKEGQVSGAVYHGGDDLVRFLVQVYGMFSLSNPLHSEVFPFVRKMECEVSERRQLVAERMISGVCVICLAAPSHPLTRVSPALPCSYLWLHQVVRMTVSLFNGDAEACGTMTSGGTESILMAMKSYRDEARSRGIEEAEIIAGESAHAAFDKAAHYFGMKLVHVPVDPVTMRVDVAAVKAAITRNTVVIIGSAPGFPHGVVDPIEELAALAQARNVGMHVDACLGGYLLPFAARLGYDIPAFDFRVPGVTSISADTHKYGYAPKGASVVMYRDGHVREKHGTCHDREALATGGQMSRPAVASGSRSCVVLISSFMCATLCAFLCSSSRSRSPPLLFFPASFVPVLRRRRMDRWHLRLAVDAGLAPWRSDRGNLGGTGAHGRGGVPRLRAGHHVHGQGDRGRHSHHSRTARAGQPPYGRGCLCSGRGHPGQGDYHQYL